MIKLHKPRYLNTGTTLTADGSAVTIKTTWRTRGTSHSAEATVDLSEKKRKLTLLKQAITQIEETTGWQYEAFEVVDITRTFIEIAMSQGHAIHGLTPPPTDDPNRKPVHQTRMQGNRMTYPSDYPYNLPPDHPDRIMELDYQQHREEQERTMSKQPPSNDSMHLAAQAWCQPETSHIAMIPELAEAFARILDQQKTPAAKRKTDALVKAITEITYLPSHPMRRKPVDIATAAIKAFHAEHNHDPLDTALAGNEQPDPRKRR